jgi:lincosamide nucleotidyltransferase A/C/D/E
MRGSLPSEMAERTGKIRQPQAPMSAARAAAILGELEARGIVVWLEGGWGIDALLEQETREHDDLDVIVSLDQVEAIETALRELGFETKRGEAPLSFEVVDGHGRQVDVHPVSFLPSGEGLYLMEGGRDWTYPAHSFAGTGEIAGRPMRCLTPDIALVCHSTGYALDAVHQRDVEALCERFSLPLPPFQTA